jgi:hypothetical protein
MANKIPPSQDANLLELGSIRVSDGTLWTVGRETISTKKWIVIDSDFTIDDLTFFNFLQSDDIELYEFVSKSELVVIDGKRQEYSNPLPVTISWTPKSVKIYLQDYGALFKIEETWANLYRNDKYNAFKTLWKRLLEKIQKENGFEDPYSYKGRIIDEAPNENIKEYILADIRDLIVLMDFIGFEYSKNEMPDNPEQPNPKYKIGDFVVGGIWSIPLKITQLADDNGQIVTIQADGDNPDDKLYVSPNEIKLFEKQPKFKVGDRILYPTTQNGSELGRGAKELIEEAKAEKIGYLVVTDITYNRYGDEVFNYWLGSQKHPEKSVSFLEQECELYEPTPEPKFKVGDIVKIIGGSDREYKVTEVYGRNNLCRLEAVTDGSETVYPEVDLEFSKKIEVGKLFFDVPPYTDNNTYLKRANGTEVILQSEKFEYIQPFAHNDMLFQWRETDKTVVMGVACKIQLFYDKGITIRYEDSFGGDIASGMITDRATFVQTMTQLSQILREGSEKEFANEVTLIQLALLDGIWDTKKIKCPFLDSKPEETPNPKFKVGDRVTFNKMPFDTFRVMEEPKYNSTKGKFVYRLANEDGKSSFSASYEEEMSLIVAVETPKDCEADATKIKEGQVKRFYDLNKARIEKLDTKISCKIIQALVGLSEYESCGSPSSSSLSKANTKDLLSRISKLKI